MSVLKACGGTGEEAERDRDGQTNQYEHMHPLRLRRPAASSEEQQILDSEQETTSACGKERHASLPGLRGKRELLVHRAALLQTALHRRQGRRRR